MVSMRSRDGCQLRSHAELPLLFDGGRVHDAYRAMWTPAAVVVAANGQIASETALGTEAITDLRVSGRSGATPMFGQMDRWADEANSGA